MNLTSTAKKILGMNARNLRIIRPANTRSAVKLARNKLETKQALSDRGLPTAELFGVIRNRQEMFDFDWSSLPSSFALKPNFGLGGSGILIIFGKNKDGGWIGSDDQIHYEDDIKLRVSNILDGNYSISNIPDVAYFEERLTLSEHFKNISYKGIPDIRVIVFNSVPVMAMLRLPTKASGGKANMQLGGIGVGIDMDTGLTNYAVTKKEGDIKTHPDYNTTLKDIQVPYWDEILRISIEAQQTIGLGYAGIDIVIDKNQGPVILEVNGHPGLEIQNANHATLRDRLQRVAGLNIASVSKGLKVSKDLFSMIPDADEDMPVLGVFESIEVTDKSGEPEVLRARIDTGLVSTTITKDLAKRFGFVEAMNTLNQVVFPTVVTSSDARQVEDAYRETVRGLHKDFIDVVAVRSGGKYVIRPKISLTFSLKNKIIKTQVAIALDNKLSHPMIVGRRDLKGFLINPAKTK